MPELDLDRLKQAASEFADIESLHHEPQLFGVTDGKAVGTYLEHKFRNFLEARFTFTLGSSASGVDFPGLAVDMKVTSVRQPQSSCPFKSARQKIFGLGYSLLIFVYDKSDDHKKKTGRLEIQHTIFVEKHRTADYTMTRILRKHLDEGANIEDLVAIMLDRNLPIDEIEAINLAEKIMKQRPEQGYLTISNALQWRLQYRRAITQAGEVEGLVEL